MTTNLVHKAPWPDWFASQDPVQGVLLCDTTSDGKVRAELPLEWGSRWRWNLTEDGTGVYLREG